MSEAATSASTTTSEQSSAARPALRHGVLGLPHAIVISVAVMSPAASIFFNTIPQAGLLGAAVPRSYLIGLLVALLGANQYSERSPAPPSSRSSYPLLTARLCPP